MTGKHYHNALAGAHNFYLDDETPRENPYTF